MTIILISSYSNVFAQDVNSLHRLIYSLLEKVDMAIGTKSEIKYLEDVKKINLTLGHFTGMIENNWTIDQVGKPDHIVLRYTIIISSALSKVGGNGSGERIPAGGMTKSKRERKKLLSIL